MQKSTISLELESGHREFFFMPAVRSIDQVEQPPITPEQVVRRRGYAWVTGDLLIELGRQLKIDVILVDLRAGITEFSSPLLLDSRIHNVIVSSCSKQSVLGVCRILEKISHHDMLSMDAQNLTFLITQVPPLKPRGDEIFADVEKDLLDTWSSISDSLESNDQTEDDSMPTVCRIDYDTDLIVFDNLKSIARKLPTTSLWSGLKDFADQFISSEIKQIAQEKMKAVRENIIRLTRDHLEFAEQSEGSEILATPPIRKLVKLQSGQLPVAVILGSKGAGKTFLWRQLLAAESFAQFSAKTEQPSSSLKEAKPTLIFPLLAPKNPNDNLKESIRKAERNILKQRKQRLDILSLSNELEERDLYSDYKGLAFWIKAISERLGLSEESSTSLRDIDEELRRHDQRLILAVDGLEDALQTSPTKPMSEDQKAIIRALILDLPNQLDAIQAKHLGIIVFIRYDFARESIPQNFNQFEARYRSLALKWNKEDALRLVLWVLQKSEWPEISFQSSDNSYDHLNYDHLKENLKPFWNEKMGGKKEAFTDRWVITVLSDLNGRFQARDIIRFLYKATEGSKDFPLSPKAMREAIQFCSDKKIEELEKEFKGLEDIFKRFKGLPRNQKTIPIRKSKLKELETEEESFLLDQGFLYKDGNFLYMPEIIWRGLGFRCLRKGYIGTLRLRKLAAPP